MKSLVTLVVFLLSVATASAQMHIDVMPDRVMIGPNEFVPRFLDEASVQQIAVGQSATISTPTVLDYIEVAGTLTVSSQVRVKHFTVLPGGVLNLSGGFEIIFRDVPLDPDDIHQWGNGLLVFGRIVVNGQEKRAWVSATADLAAGATSFTSSDPLTGWATGDELIIPDTTGAWRREAVVTVASISGQTVTLSKALDFAHPAIRRLNEAGTGPGIVEFQPVVANVTRQGKMRSENPNGTRGHAAIVGHASSFDVRHLQCSDMGRTKLEVLDPVTNHVGRYGCFHVHHAVGAGSQLIGVVNQRSSKWAATMHNTSDALIQWNVGVEIPGGCLTTEDGNEYRNVFDRNMCVYSRGAANNHSNATQFIVDNNPAGEGPGGWFRGVQNTYTGNVFIANEGVGMNFMNTLLVAGDTHTNRIVLARNNTTIGSRTGLELWGTNLYNVSGELAFEDHLTANNYQNVFAGANFPSSDMGFKNMRNIGASSLGVNSTMVYVMEARFEGGYIGASGTATNDGIARRFVIKDAVFQTNHNINMGHGGIPERSRIENVVHLPYVGVGADTFISFGPERAPTQAEADAAEQPIIFSGYPNGPMTGSHHVVIKHQGIAGADFTLYAKGQLSADPLYRVSVPTEVCGKTMGESWANCGVSWRGAVLDASQAVLFPGLLYGYARSGVTPDPLLRPLAILHYPNRYAPYRNGGYFGHGVIEVTGDSTGTGPNVIVHHKGPGEAEFTLYQVLGPNEYQAPHYRSLWGNYAPGEHFWRMWRTRADGSPIAESEMTFSNCEPDACDAPLPPPLPPVNCTVSEFKLVNPTDPNVGWGQCTMSGTQTRTENWLRVIETEASGGGSCDFVLEETRTASRPCMPPPPTDPPPTSTPLPTVTVKVCQPNGGPCVDTPIPLGPQ